jgi:DNA primase
MYDVAKLLPLFVSVLGEANQFANNEYYFHCPFCHHHNPKLAVNLGKGKWQCWVCGSKGGRLVSLFKKLDVPQYQLRELYDILQDEIRYVEKSGDTVKVNLRLPPGAKPMWKKSNEIEFKHAKSYLIERGTSFQDLLRYNLHYCTDGPFINRIIIPSYDIDGQLNFFTGRDFFNTSPLKYKNPQFSKNIIGFEYHINWQFPITLCEGPMDAMAIKWNAIPLFGKTISSKLFHRIIEKKVEEVYIALDVDAKDDATAIAEMLMKEGIKVHVANLPDKDPSILGFETMHSILQNSKTSSFRDLIQMKIS